MAKKGVIEEIFSKARFADDAKKCTVLYRDFKKIKETTCLNLLKNQIIFKPFQSQE